MESLDKKLEEANILLKELIKDNFRKDDWVYTDFVKEDRFFYEIKTDKNINIEKSGAEELAEYAYEMICDSSRRANLFGF